MNSNAKRPDTQLSRCSPQLHSIGEHRNSIGAAQDNGRLELRCTGTGDSISYVRMSHHSLLLATSVTLSESRDSWSAQAKVSGSQKDCGPPRVLLEITQVSSAHVSDPTELSAMQRNTPLPSQKSPASNNCKNSQHSY